MTRLAQAGWLSDPNGRGSVTFCDVTKASRLTGEQMPPGLVGASVVSCHRICGVAWEFREHAQPARARSPPGL